MRLRLASREALLGAAAALIRLLYLIVHPSTTVDVYWALSTSVLRHGLLGIDGRPTTQFEPGYPVFLAVARAIVRAPFLVDMLQIGVASIGAICLYRLAATLTGSLRAATIAAALFAIDPLLIREAAGHSESAPFTTLLIAFALAFVTAATVRRAAFAGVWLGLSILTRAAALPLLVLAPALLLARRRSSAAAALFAAALLVLVPMPVRNHAVNGSWLPTRSGVNLFIGNSPHTAALLPEDDLDLLQTEAADLVETRLPEAARLPAPQAERAVDAFLTREALAFIAAHPLATMNQKARNLWYFVSPRLVPYRTATRESRLVASSDGGIAVEGTAARPMGEVVVYAVASSVLSILAVVGIYWRRDRLREDAILWCIAGACVAVNVLYVPATRYRAPMEFVVLFYAAAGVDALRGAAGRPRGGLARSVVVRSAFGHRERGQVPVHDELRRAIRFLRRRRVGLALHPTVS